MIRNPILTHFEELSRLLQPAQRDLHSAFLRPDKLPAFVQDCPPAMRILDLVGPLPWNQFPERDLQRFWGQTTIPHVAFSAACIIKLRGRFGFNGGSPSLSGGASRFHMAAGISTGVLLQVQTAVSIRMPVCPPNDT